MPLKRQHVQIADWIDGHVGGQRTFGLSKPCTGSRMHRPHNRQLQIRDCLEDSSMRSVMSTFSALCTVSR